MIVFVAFSLKKASHYFYLKVCVVHMFKNQSWGSRLHRETQETTIRQCAHYIVMITTDTYTFTDHRVLDNVSKCDDVGAASQILQNFNFSLNFLLLYWLHTDKRYNTKSLMTMHSINRQVT